MHISALNSRRTLVALGVGAALAATLTACGGSDPSTVASPPSAGASVQGVATVHNDADVTFIQDMTPHHAGAIGMAQLASDRAASPQVKDLARRIAGAQAPEIDRMKAMATAWGAAAPSMDGGMGGMSGGMDDVKALTPLRGSAFDREFLTRMTKHHSSAVDMSKQELAQGTNPQAKELATSIISAQEKEIAEMQQLLTKL